MFTLPMGYHSFHWEATDSSNNKADCQFVVAVDSKKCRSFGDDRSSDWKNNFQYEVTDKNCVNRDGATVKITCQESSKKLRFSNAGFDQDDDSAKYLSQINAHCKNGQWLDPTLIATCVETKEDDYDDGGAGYEYEDQDAIDDELDGYEYEMPTDRPETPAENSDDYSDEDDEKEDEADGDSDSSDNDKQDSDETSSDTNDEQEVPASGGGGGTVVIVIILVTLFAVGGTIAFKRYKDNIKVAQNLGRTILSGKDNGGMNLGGDTNQAYSPM